MQHELTEQQNNFLLYKSKDGRININVILQDETVWLNQKALSELFGVDRSVITKHLGNIFKESELIEDSVCAIFAHTAADGKTYNTKF